MRHTRYEKFIVSELWTLSWNASVQRASLFIYDTKKHLAFKEAIISFVNDNLIESYRAPVSEETHLKNIVALSAAANLSCGPACEGSGGQGPR